MFGRQLSRFVISIDPISIRNLFFNLSFWKWFFVHLVQFQFLQILEYSMHQQYKIFEYVQILNFNKIQKAQHVICLCYNSLSQQITFQALKKLIIKLMGDQIKIKVYRAILKRDLRALSQMVPYAVVQIGKITKKTLIDDKGGKRPTWNQVLDFQTKETTGKISVYDRDNFNDQLIGQGKFDLKNISEVEESVIQIQYQFQVIGKVFIKLITKPKTIINPEVPSLQVFSPTSTPALTPTKMVSPQSQPDNIFKHAANYMFQDPAKQHNFKHLQSPHKSSKQIDPNIPVPSFMHSQPQHYIKLPTQANYNISQQPYVNYYPKNGPAPMLIHRNYAPISVPYPNSYSPPPPPPPPHHQHQNYYSNQRNINYNNSPIQLQAYNSNKMNRPSQHNDLLDQFVNQQQKYSFNPVSNFFI